MASPAEWVVTLVYTYIQREGTWSTQEIIDAETPDLAVAICKAANGIRDKGFYPKHGNVVNILDVNDADREEDDSSWDSGVVQTEEVTSLEDWTFRKREAGVGSVKWYAEQELVRATKGISNDTP